MSRKPMSEREIDALVAEKVMGLGIVEEHSKYELCHEVDGKSCGGIVPHYSTDIAAAWAVVEKIQGMFIKTFDGNKNDWDCFEVDVRAWKSSDGWGWSCRINGWTACADTAPMAICLAALSAVGVDLAMMGGGME